MRTLLLLLALATAAACAQSTTERLGLDPPETVSGFELDRYLGTWFEVGSYPQSFQEGCVGTTARYVLRDDGNIDVFNSCLVDGEPNDAKGVARPVDIDEGKLEVSFFGPFFGDYWILELGEADGAESDYTHAVVASPGRDMLWILSRTPELDDETLDSIFDGLAAQTFDAERFVFTAPAP